MNERIDNLFTSVKEIIYHGLFYSFGQLFYNAVSFIFLPIYTRYFLPSEYGNLSLLVVTSSLLICIFELGMTSALFVSYYDYSDEQKKIKVISTNFFILLVSSLILSIVGYFISPSLSKLIFKNLMYTKHLYLLFLISSLNILEGLPYAIFRVKKQSREYVFFNFISLFLRIFLIILFVVFQKRGILGVLIANFLCSFFSVSVLYFYIRKSIRKMFSFTEMKKMFTYGLFLVPDGIARFILNYSGNYFLKLFCGSAIVGIYNIGTSISSLVNFILIFPSSLIWYPIALSVKGKPYAKKLYSLGLTYFLFIGFFLILGITLIGKEIIDKIIRESYRDYHRVLLLLLLSWLLLGVYMCIGIGVVLKRKTYYAAAVFVSAAIINLYLNFLLIPIFGMMGAAFGVVIAYSFLCIVQYIIARKIYKIDYEWMRIGKILLCGAAIYFLGLNISYANFFKNLFFKTVIVFLFPISLMLFSFYTNEEKTGLLRLIDIIKQKCSQLLT